MNFQTYKNILTGEILCRKIFINGTFEYNLISKVGIDYDLNDQALLHLLAYDLNHNKFIDLYFPEFRIKKVLEDRDVSYRLLK